MCATRFRLGSFSSALSPGLHQLPFTYVYASLSKDSAGNPGLPVPQATNPQIQIHLSIHVHTGASRPSMRHLHSSFQQESRRPRHPQHPQARRMEPHGGCTRPAAGPSGVLEDHDGNTAHSTKKEVFSQLDRLTDLDEGLPMMTLAGLGV